MGRPKGSLNKSTILKQQQQQQAAAAAVAPEKVASEIKQTPDDPAPQLLLPELEEAGESSETPSKSGPSPSPADSKLSTPLCAGTATLSPEIVGVPAQKGVERRQEPRRKRRRAAAKVIVLRDESSSSSEESSSSSEDDVERRTHDSEYTVVQGRKRRRRYKQVLTRVPSRVPRRVVTPPREEPEEDAQLQQQQQQPRPQSSVSNLHSQHLKQLAHQRSVYDSYFSHLK